MKPIMKQHIVCTALFLIVTLFYGCLLPAQDSLTATKKVSDYLIVTGYIKNMGTLNFAGDANTLYGTYLVHNRIDIKIMPAKGFTIAAGLRSRILLSEYQNLIPGFGRQFSSDRGIVKLSYNWVDRYPALFNTTIDRLYFDWKNDKWNVRIGRQRLNWGVNLTWNPNDIFNTYNLLDFDYEERPGTDAVKAAYNFTSFSNIEAAIAPARNKDSIIGAVKYSFNTHNYDLQFFAGNYCKDAVLGIGWAGNIKDAGFKGEVTWFHGWRDNRFKNDAVSASATIDYSFTNGVYLAGSFLINNLAPNSSVLSISQLQSGTLSPKMLMPARYTIMLQTQKEFSPIARGSIACIYSPVVNLLVISPSFTYSVVDNFDLDLVVQSYFANNTYKKISALGNSVNVRLRWSFSN
jgi:hypothetical protein